METKQAAFHAIACSPSESELKASLRSFHVLGRRGGRLRPVGIECDADDAGLSTLHKERGAVNLRWRAMMPILTQCKKNSLTDRYFEPQRMQDVKVTEKCLLESSPNATRDRLTLLRSGRTRVHLTFSNPSPMLAGCCEAPNSRTSILSG